MCLFVYLCVTVCTDLPCNTNISNMWHGPHQKKKRKEKKGSYRYVNGIDLYIKAWKWSRKKYFEIHRLDVTSAILNKSLEFYMRDSDS